MNKTIKGVGFGDVHNGHNTTPTAKIAEELKECFPYGSWAHGLDICVIDGDWYDKLLPNNHADAYMTESSIFYMLRWAKEHDILLLVVDGTPLHDAGQIQKFVHINNEAKIGAQLVLVDTIDIVYISRFDMYVLFIPDRPRTSPKEIYQIVLDKLKALNIESVDMAVMHGCFQYQLPELAQEHKHVEEDYEKIVKGPIIIGHIHRHSSKGNIIAPGSFSRLAHGEEEPKGFVEFEMKPTGQFKAKFHENKTATKYISINVTGLNLEDSFQKIKETIKDLPSMSRIRVVCEQNHPISLDKAFMVLKVEHVDYFWTIKVNVDNKVIADEDEVFSLENDYVPLVINKENITDLIVSKADNKGYDNAVLQSIPHYMDSILKD